MIDATMEIARPGSPANHELAITAAVATER